MFDFLSRKFSGIFSSLTSAKKLSEKVIEGACLDVTNALLEADVPHDVATDFVSGLKTDCIGAKVSPHLKPDQQFMKLVHDKMVDFLGGDSDIPTFKKKSVIMLMGLQGSGKTTSIAKLIAHLKKTQANKGDIKILTGSVDFYRPAAIDQLEILAQKQGVSLHRSSCDEPVSAARDLYNTFVAGGYDYLLVDTAGRMHIDSDMLVELTEVYTQTKPDYRVLVLDAMTGQESLAVARAFDQAVGFDGAILSKMDSGARAGGAFGFCYTLKKDIWFIGTGEKPDDLEPFIPKRIAGRMLDMGDVLTLAEKADEVIDRSTQESMAQRLKSGHITLDDFAQQMSMLDKMGSLQKVMRFIPGMQSIPADKLEEGQQEMRIFRAILSSMTLKERQFPHLIDRSRKMRIAQGSGTSLGAIDKLLSRFEQSKQFVKMFKNGGKFGNLF